MPAESRFALFRHTGTTGVNPGKNTYNGIQHKLILLASLLLILFCCIVFVNAIELLGKAFNLQPGYCGEHSAAIGTAMPETLIPIIAILFTGGKGSRDVGIGAIAGAPFMLARSRFSLPAQRSLCIHSWANAPRG